MADDGPSPKKPTPCALCLIGAAFVACLLQAELGILVGGREGAVGAAAGKCSAVPGLSFAHGSGPCTVTQASLAPTACMQTHCELNRLCADAVNNPEHGLAAVSIAEINVCGEADNDDVFNSALTDLGLSGRRQDTHDFAFPPSNARPWLTQEFIPAAWTGVGVTLLGLASSGLVVWFLHEAALGAVLAAVMDKCSHPSTNAVVRGHQTRPFKVFCETLRVLRWQVVAEHIRPRDAEAPHTPGMGDDALTSMGQDVVGDISATLDERMPPPFGHCWRTRKLGMLACMRLCASFRDLRGDKLQPTRKDGEYLRAPHLTTSRTQAHRYYAASWLVCACVALTPTLLALCYPLAPYGCPAQGGEPTSAVAQDEACDDGVFAYSPFGCAWTVPAVPVEYVVDPTRNYTGCDLGFVTYSAGLQTTTVPLVSNSVVELLGCTSLLRCSTTPNFRPTLWATWFTVLWYLGPCLGVATFALLFLLASAGGVTADQCLAHAFYRTVGVAYRTVWMLAAVSAAGLLVAGVHIVADSDYDSGEARGSATTLVDVGVYVMWLPAVLLLLTWCTTHWCATHRHRA